MPIYEYECRACRRRFELIVRSQTPQVCPSCGGDVERLVSSFAVSSPEIRRRTIHAKRLENRPSARDKAIAEYEEFKHSHE